MQTVYEASKNTLGMEQKISATKFRAKFVSDSGDTRHIKIVRTKSHRWFTLARLGITTATTKQPTANRGQESAPNPPICNVICFVSAKTYSTNAELMTSISRALCLITYQ
mmetsp:Transcript_28814/g.46394  ORF Transcript_28814/g.46394 Transcript_28814/m.46394 type:complete len:110 (+) Transcript_28814:314-643(+)